MERYDESLVFIDKAISIDVSVESLIARSDAYQGQAPKLNSDQQLEKYNLALKDLRKAYKFDPDSDLPDYIEKVEKKIKQIKTMYEMHDFYEKERTPEWYTNVCDKNGTLELKMAEAEKLKAEVEKQRLLEEKKLQDLLKPDKKKRKNKKARLREKNQMMQP